MLYPSVQQLTDERVNRYSLVIAIAKGARYVTDMQAKEREEAELHRDDHSKEYKPLTVEAANEKAVSVAVKKLVDEEFKIVVPSDENK